MADVNEKLLNGAGLAELWELVKSADATVQEQAATALAAAIEPCAKIQTGSYTGNGKYGSSNPNSLTFNFVPKFLMVCPVGATNAGYLFMQPHIHTTSFGAGCFICFGGVTDSDFKGKLVGATFSWYGPDAKEQCNISGSTHRWVAIG